MKTTENLGPFQKAICHLGLDVRWCLAVDAFPPDWPDPLTFVEVADVLYTQMDGGELLIQATKKLLEYHRLSEEYTS